MLLKDLLFKEKGKLFLYAIGVLLASVTNIVFTFGMKYSFSVLEVDNINQMLLILAGSIALMIAPAILQLTSRMLRIGFMSDVLKEVRIMAYQKIMNQDIESFNKEEREVYQSALISDINLFEDDFFLSLLNIGFSFFSSLFSLIILFGYSWTIAAVALTTSFIQLLIAKFYEKRVRNARKASQKQNKKYNTVLSNMVSGFKTIKSYASETIFAKRFSDEVITLEETKANFFQYNKNQELASHSVSTLSSVLIYFIAAYLMSQGQVKIGDFIVVINLSSSLVWGMISAISFFNRLKASTDIYYRLVDVEIKSEDIKQSKLNSVDIEVDDLSFSYGDKLILDKMNLVLKPNEKVLIYGASGTGKTTLLNCLAQNLSGYTGSIDYGTSPLHLIDHRDFLDVSAYVRQRHFMFNDSIVNNIIMENPYDENKFWDVIKKASLFEWVSDVGMDHQLIQNGSNVSGGQRQRLSLARELYSEFDIIFIDEPSASLDDENAKVIYDTILGLEKSVVCVSHRHLDLLKGRFDHVVSFKEVVYENGK